MSRKDMGKVKCLPTKFDLVGTGKCYWADTSLTYSVYPMCYKYVDPGYYLVRYCVDFSQFATWQKSADDGVSVRMGVWNAAGTSSSYCKTSGLETEYKYIDYHSVLQRDLHHSVSRHIQVTSSNRYILCGCTWGSVAAKSTMGTNDVDMPYWVEIIRVDKT